MKTKTKRDKEEFEHSDLLKHIEQLSLSWERFNKIDIEIILNGNLTIADKAVYIALLDCINNKAFYKVAIKELCVYTGLNKDTLVKCINKLVEFKIIQKQKNCFESSYLLNKVSRKYIKFEGGNKINLANNYRDYIKKLELLCLSNGNDFIPSFKTCLKKMINLNKVKYSELNKIRNIYKTDVELYRVLG